MAGIIQDKISFMAMIISLFARKHKFNEPVAYQYIRRYGGDRLLVEHYAYLHTQDYDQVVDDLGAYCKRQGGGIK